MLKARTAWLGVCLATSLAIAGIVEAQAPAHAQTQAQRLRQLQQQTEQQQRELDLQQRRAEQQQNQIEQQQQEIDQRRREVEQLRSQFELLRQRQAAPAPPPSPAAPASRSAGQPPAEHPDRSELSALNTRLLILAAVLASFGLFQFIAFGLQAFYVWLAMRSMQRTTALAERNLTLTQRAFVSVRSLNSSVKGDVVTIVPTWENNGATPARSLRISTNWRSLHGDLPPDFQYNYQRAPERVFLGPRAASDIGELTIPLRDVQAAMEQRVQLYVWGRATYEDVFEGTEPHFIEFCYLLEPSAGPGGAIRLRFAHYGPYNRADGDSLRPSDPDLR